MGLDGVEQLASLREKNELGVLFSLSFVYLLGILWCCIYWAGPGAFRFGKCLLVYRLGLARWCIWQAWMNEFLGMMNEVGGQNKGKRDRRIRD